MSSGGVGCKLVVLLRPSFVGLNLSNTFFCYDLVS